MWPSIVPVTRNFISTKIRILYSSLKVLRLTDIGKRSGEAGEGNC